MFYTFIVNKCKNNNYRILKNFQIQMFRCVVCSLQAPTYETVEELEIHIAADHISHVPYECERCRFSKFPTEFALISHCTTDHGLKEFYVSYFIY